MTKLFSKHLKRIKLVKEFNTSKLGGLFAIKSINKGYLNKLSFPLFLLVKNILKLSRSYAETKNIIRQRNFIINNNYCINPKTAIYFLDILSVPKLQKNYRMFLDKTGKMKLFCIPKLESMIKIFQVKRCFKKSKNLQIIVTNDNKIFRYRKKINIHNSIIVRLKDNKILYILKMKIGSLCLIVNGKYSGILATVVAIKKTYNFEDSIHLIKFDGNKIVKRINDLIIVGEFKVPFMSLYSYNS